MATKIQILQLLARPVEDFQYIHIHSTYSCHFSCSQHVCRSGSNELGLDSTDQSTQANRLCLTVSNTPSNTRLYIHMHTPDFPEHVQSRAALRPTRVLHRWDCLWWIYTTEIKKKLTLMSCMCLNKTQDVCYKSRC